MKVCSHSREIHCSRVILCAATFGGGMEIIMKKHFGSKFATRLLTVFLIVATVCVSFAACAPKTDEEMIADRIREFQNAYNSGDMDALIETLEPTTKNAMKATVSILQSLLGGKLGVDISLSDLFSLGVYYMDDNGVIRFDIERIVIEESGTKAAAEVIMNYGQASSAQNVTAYFEFVKTNSGWFIKDVSDNMPSILRTAQ